MCYYGIRIAVSQENEKRFFIFVRYDSRYYLKTKNGLQYYFGTARAFLFKYEKRIFILVRYGSRFLLCNVKRFLFLYGRVRAFCIKLENGYFPCTILIALLVKNQKYFSFLIVRFALLTIIGKLRKLPNPDVLVYFRFSSHLRFA